MSSLSFDVGVENEQVVIRTLMEDITLVKDMLPEWFAAEVHANIVSAAVAIFKRGGKYSDDTVVELSPGEVTIEYLVDLRKAFDPLPKENFILHLDRLRDSVAKRSAHEAFQRLYDALDDDRAPLVDAEVASLEVLSQLRSRGGSLSPDVGVGVADEWIEKFNRRGPETFKPTYLAEVDIHLLDGFKAGELSVIAARPGMGKSSTLSNVISRQISNGKKWLLLPIEPGKDAVIEQIVCLRTGIPFERMKKEPHKLAPDERETIVKTIRDLMSDGNLSLYDRYGMKLDHLEVMLRSEKYDGVAIDLFEYLLKPGWEVNDVTEALRRLRGICQDVGTHALVLHQIRRRSQQTKKQQDNPGCLRPGLTELKGSGGWEEVADLIMFLHRNSYYDPSSEEKEIDIHIAKQRHGESGEVVTFEFHPEICKIGRYVRTFKKGFQG